MSVEEEYEPAAEAAEEEEGPAPYEELPVEEDESADDRVEDQGVVLNGPYNADDINDQIFEELQLHPDVVQQTQNIWAAYLKAAESPEVAAEALYAAIFDAAPGLQALFKTSRAILAGRLLRGIGGILGHLADPKLLKATTETLAFQHLDYEVTVPRVALFRDAIIEVIAAELGMVSSAPAMVGLKVVLNYTGGALIYVRVHYAARLKILSTSWALANKQSADEMIQKKSGEGNDEDGERGLGSGAGAIANAKKAADSSGKAKTPGASEGKSASQSQAAKRGNENVSIPRTFQEMFRFNAAVMGFSEHGWMNEVLLSFDAIVKNVSSSYRLQEECDVLSLRLSKCTESIDLADYKAVMFASLRSLVPKGWDSDHEVAWSWLWKNVERLLLSQMGKLAQQERALTRLFDRIEGDDRGPLHRKVYVNFFEIAPNGQDYFKQSTTRLHFVAEKVATMTLEMYKDPDALVSELSACGLRHVGYGIPSDLCSSFAAAYTKAMKSMVDDAEAVDAFDWSLSLIARVIARVINEGSTLVMKAININSGKQLAKAVACAPRSERANWVLRVSVGSQSISPLLWAIETGSLDAAEAIIKDLLTIRADRDRYYYGVDALFERHPDILKRLCLDAPGLLPALLDSLIWRSRLTEGGRRRVVYFCKHLIVGEEGDFSRAVEWIVQNGDPKIVCHPVISYVIDLVWARVAATNFLYRKTWLLLTATVFMLSQAILNGGMHDEVQQSMAIRASIFLSRGFIYAVSWPSLAMVHIKRTRMDIKTQNFKTFGRFKVPGHLFEFNSIASLSLCIILAVMLALCPILHCLGSPSVTGEYLLLTERCEKGDRYLEAYAFFCMLGMLCYWALLADLSVFSNRVCAFLLIFGHVLSEVGLFLIGAAFVLLVFSTAAAALKVEDYHFSTIPNAAQEFVQMFLGMASSEMYTHLLDFPILFCLVVVFCFTTGVYMVNLLIAQLSCAYRATFQDMIGFARLKRGSVCVASISSVSKKRWTRFVESLRLDEPCEFGEGDIGMPGAIQFMEPANANVTTMELIRRFGGSTSGSAPWPEEEGSTDAEDKMDKLERLLKAVMRKVTDGGGRRRGGNGSSTVGSSVAHGSSSGSSERSGRDE